MILFGVLICCICLPLSAFNRNAYWSETCLVVPFMLLCFVHSHFSTKRLKLRLQSLHHLLQTVATIQALWLKHTVFRWLWEHSVTFMLYHSWRVSPSNLHHVHLFWCSVFRLFALFMRSYWLHLHYIEIEITTRPSSVTTNKERASSSLTTCYKLPLWEIISVKNYVFRHFKTYWFKKTE